MAIKTISFKGGIVDIIKLDNGKENLIIDIIQYHPKNKELLDQQKGIWDVSYFSQTLEA